MGYSSRLNIFKSGTRDQIYFANSPVQVAVLFSPKDEAFFQAFREFFLHGGLN